MPENPRRRPSKAGDWLSGLEFFGIKLGLDQTRELFRRAGDPHKKLKFIHVAGSNGKGSVCTLLDAALRNAGFKTGFYSSPHLVDPRERLRVDGRLPGESVFGALIEEARAIVEDMRREGAQPTYFEVTTLIAALHFARERVDFVLWETGMGGRLDATNIVDPLCSVITSISLEHSDRLGGTLEKIAFEKAGIVKPGAPVFCANIPSEALGAIAAKAKESGSELILPALDAEHAPSKIELRPGLPPVQSFVLEGRELKISLLGPRQRANAALCVKILQWLSGRFPFDLDKAMEGFAKAKWPARLQILPESRTVIDGAHNPEAAESLASTLAEAFPGERFQLVVGSFKDKDSKAVIGSLAKVASEFVFVPVDSTRPSWSPEELSALLDSKTPHRCATSLAEALSEGIPCGGRRLVCGSLHLCGEALSILNVDSDEALSL